LLKYIALHIVNQSNC